MIPLPWTNTCLDRSSATVEEVLDRSLGIYSTQPTGHLELLARLDGYRIDDLRRVVEVDRSAIRVSTLRGSGFVIPVPLLPIVQAATRDRRVRSLGFVERSLQTADYETWARRVDDALADGPLASDEIRARLDPPEADAGNIRYVVRLMATENRIVAATTSGTWRSDRTSFARWDDWLPDVDVWSLDPEEARASLARLYLDRHGPATPEDFAWWAGLTKTQASACFALAATPVEGTGSWRTRPVEDAPPPPLRLLPIWDTLFVTYRDRSRFVADEHYPLVYDKDGNATSVILVDGRAAGQWTMAGTDSGLEIRLAPFRAFTASQQRAVAEEAERIGNFVGATELRIADVAEPVDLTAAPRNRFMSPLRVGDAT